MHALAAGALVVGALGLSSNVARAAGVDVVVDSTDITLTSATDGTHTATVTLANIGSSLVNVQAGIPGDAGCTVTPDPASVASGRRAVITLTLSTGCETSKGANIMLNAGPSTTYVLAAAPAPPADNPNWDILTHSFLAAFVIAVLVAVGMLLYMGNYNRLTPPTETSGGAAPDAPSPGNAPVHGPIPAATYEYVVTLVRRRPARFSRTGKKRESAGSSPLPVKLEHPSQVELILPLGDNATIERRIYRTVSGKDDFRRVGEVTDNETTKYVDSWTPMSLGTELTSLGTNWSFKDNWISSVTVGSGVLVGLLGTSNVLQAVLGSEPKAALGLIAVAGALAAVFVGISPLLTKVIGHDLSVPTIAGTLTAAVLTIVGSIGEIFVVTWQGWDLATSWVQLAIAVLGLGVAAIILWYAVKSLWYWMKTGSRFAPPKSPDVSAPSFSFFDQLASLPLTEGTVGVRKPPGPYL